MAANIVFVDEGTVGEVVGGEDSDFDENTDNYESSEEEGDRREEDSDDEEVATKNPKKTTGSLVIVSREGLTSQLIEGSM